MKSLHKILIATSFLTIGSVYAQTETQTIETDSIYFMKIIQSLKLKCQTCNTKLLFTSKNESLLNIPFLKMMVFGFYLEIFMFIKENNTLIFNYKHINQGNHTLFDSAVINNKDAVVYGGLAPLRLKRYLIGDVLVFLQGQTQMLWGTQREQLRPHIGFGLRITL